MDAPCTRVQKVHPAPFVDRHVKDRRTPSLHPRRPLLDRCGQVSCRRLICKGFGAGPMRAQGIGPSRLPARVPRTAFEPFSDVDIAGPQQPLLTHSSGWECPLWEPSAGVHVRGETAASEGRRCVFYSAPVWESLGVFGTDCCAACSRRICLIHRRVCR